ncbi:MAG: hypothetical protein JXN61_04185 [Sedimentisphaerales bacterium]|nr:hypothetical protein [Sedimentisphaerales bacterium]
MFTAAGQEKNAEICKKAKIFRFCITLLEKSALTLCFDQVNDSNQRFWAEKGYPAVGMLAVGQRFWVFVAGMARFAGQE